MKKIIFVLIIFSLPYCFVFANIGINEIMYDLKTGSDDGREWVEVYNNSDKIVDLSTFKYFEADTNHKLLFIQGDAKIGAQSYAIIVSDPVKFKVDLPNFYGTILDSTFSLNNTGETLAIKSEEEILDTYTYQSSSGGAGDGKSLQKINGVWQSAVPTPGVENKITYIAPLPPPPKNNIAPIKTPELNSSDNEILTEIPTLIEETIPTENSSPLSIIILILLLSVGGGIVYFVRKNKAILKIGDDFEILDE